MRAVLHISNQHTTFLKSSSLEDISAQASTAPTDWWLLEWMAIEPNEMSTALGRAGLTGV